MRRIKSKKKSLLIIGVVDFVFVLYTAVLVLAFLKVFGKDNTKVNYVGYVYSVTNEVITSESHLDGYSYTYEDEDKTMRFSSSGSNGSIGAVEPHTYLYGTTSSTLFISFKIEGTKVARVTYDEVKICDDYGSNISVLDKSKYTSYKKDGWFTFEYSDSAPKYIYSVSLTYYVSK